MTNAVQGFWECSIISKMVVFAVVFSAFYPHVIFFMFYPM